MTSMFRKMAHTAAQTRLILVFSLLCVSLDRDRSYATEYLVGCGSADITGPAAGFPMDGYVRKDQITEGIHLRQFARAFIVAEPGDGQRLIFVAAEIGKIHEEIHRKVLDRLKLRYGDLYRDENVVLSATHTHGGAGGYWRYEADGPVGSGFFLEYVEAIANGIVSAVEMAHEQLQPGRVLIARGDVLDANAQRSRVAYLNNPKSERELYTGDTDTEMTLLKLVSANPTAEELGMLNWFAVHPTSMTYNNHLLTSDSKGYAAAQFERQIVRSEEQPIPFVAAFAQSNCGDVTGNLNLDNSGPGEDEFESTQIIGQRQLDAAWQLYSAADEELSGPIDVRQAYVDFSDLSVDHEFTESGTQHTSVAAYGYSFAAGSTEDGGGHPLFREGMIERNPAIDVIAVQMFPDYQPDERIRELHQPKPILFAPGAAKSNPGMAQVLPISICRIGQLVIIVGPAEFTTMSGRRIRRSLEEVFGDAAKYLVIAGYSNTYGGYVSTREEYEMQHYEGGHTLFGPWTLAGYQQEYVRLARAMVAGAPAIPGPNATTNLVSVRPRTIRLGHDIKPDNAEFGDVDVEVHTEYSRGEHVEAAFWTGHPRNSFQPGGNYLSVQHKLDGRWVTIFTDADWETKCRWQPSLNALQACRIFIDWDIPTDQEPGVYRIVHHGRYLLANHSEPEIFEAATTPFRVN